MNKLQTLVVAALCGVVFSVSAQAETSGYATVVRVAGAAYYSLGAGQAEYPLVAGKKLPAGATIRTEANGVVDVVLGKSVVAPQASMYPGRIAPPSGTPIAAAPINYQPTVAQNVVRLTPNTTLGIDKLTVTDTGADTVSDTELNLKSGKIYASVKKLTGASQYLIKLPNGIAGVRGTMFSITAQGTVEVYESAGEGVVLSLATPGGTTVTYLIAPGQYFDSANGKPIELPPGASGPLEQVFNSLPLIFPNVFTYCADTTKIYISPVHGYSN